MNQTINPVALTAAAERLQWVLQQYPESEDVQALLRALLPLIEAAKAGLVAMPIDAGEIPGTRNNAEGVYIPYKDPGVGDAYAKFKIELGGGLTEQDRIRHAEMEVLRSWHN